MSGERCEVKFYPGVALEEFEKLCVGRKRIDVVRELLDATPLPEERSLVAFLKLTNLGKDIKRFWGKSERVLAYARQALEISQAFKYEAQDCGRKKFSGMSRGKRNFHLKLELELHVKLDALSRYAGVSMTMVLRYLILGLKLPDELALKTASRMSQIGGLLRHVAWAQPNSGAKIW